MDCDEENAVNIKIINELDEIFKNNSSISTFEIIHLPSNQNTNKSPVILQENNLGLESWCVQHIYEYSHKNIFAAIVKSEHSKHDHTTNILKYLTVAILINPDVSTFWNLRRKLFVKNQLDIGREFKYSSLVLSKKPKSNEAFSYRRWLFSFQSGESIDWTFELSLCERCADKSFSNYHAWCHRQWVLEKAPFLLKYEPRFTEKFIRKHICDYSGYYHRQYVMDKILDTGCYDEQTYQVIHTNEWHLLRSYLTKLIDQEQTISLPELMDLLKPNSSPVQLSKNQLNTLLYCLNLCVYDLELCTELQLMYGCREAFNFHRKALVIFFVKNCSVVKNSSEIIARLVNYLLEDSKQAEIVEGVKLHDQKVDEFHRKWCKIYFNISNEN